MATNRHAMIRYKVLDKCFSNHFKEYYIDNLIEECNKELRYYDGNSCGVSRRTIFSDMDYMKSDSGWQAPIEAFHNGRRVYYRYSDPRFSIYKADLTSDELSELKETLMMLQRLKGMPNFEWLSEIITNLEDKLHLKGSERCVLGFEQIEMYTGFDYLTDLFHYIVNKQALIISYQPFNKDVEEWTIHPYYIKQYNNRWFLFGFNDATNTISNIALDRIIDVKPAAIPYKENTIIDFDSYFDDIVGVSVKSGNKEIITLKLSMEWLPFVETKAIHQSQVVKDREAGILELKLIPNNELDAILLSYGDKVEVLSPEWYRERIKGKIERSLSRYL